jgi:hypothetical protein
MARITLELKNDAGDMLRLADLMVIVCLWKFVICLPA